MGTPASELTLSKSQQCGRLTTKLRIFSRGNTTFNIEGARKIEYTFDTPNPKLNSPNSHPSSSMSPVSVS